MCCLYENVSSWQSRLFFRLELHTKFWKISDADCFSYRNFDRKLKNDNPQFFSVGIPVRKADINIIRVLIRLEFWTEKQMASKALERLLGWI